MKNFLKKYVFLACLGFGALGLLNAAEAAESPQVGLDPAVVQLNIAVTLFTAMEALAVQGDVLAQFGLGFMYFKGTAVEQNFQKAFFWYEKAAIQGLADAQFNLGLMYRDGSGIVQDYKKAAYWLKKSADQGFKPAKEKLIELGKASLVVKP